MSSKTLILRKIGGFYQAFDDDALIMSYLFNYKVINYRCGFPISSINKVIEKLEELNINYILKQEEEIEKDFKRKNNYLKYLDKSKVKDSINNRIHNILNKLDKLDKNKLEELLTTIEDLVYEN